MAFNTEPPAGILDPQQPWYKGKLSDIHWDRFKAKLTGGTDAGGTSYFSMVSVTKADADTIIANMKKDPRGYPQMDQGNPAALYDYQNWIVSEYLEQPFREETDKKIEEDEFEARKKELEDAAREKREQERAKREEEKRIKLEADKAAKEAERAAQEAEKAAKVAEETKPEVKAVAEAIGGSGKKVDPKKVVSKAAQISDPWEGSYNKTTPNASPSPSSVTPPPPAPPETEEQKQVSQGVFPKVEGIGLLDGLSEQVIALKQNLFGIKEDISSLQKESEAQVTILQSLLKTLEDGTEIKRKAVEQQKIDQEEEQIKNKTDTSGAAEPERISSGGDEDDDDEGGFNPLDFIEDFFDFDFDGDDRKKDKRKRDRDKRRRKDRNKDRKRNNRNNRRPNRPTRRPRRPTRPPRLPRLPLGGPLAGALLMWLMDMVDPDPVGGYDQTHGPEAWYNHPGYRGPRPPEYERGGISRGSKTAILHGKEAIIPVRSTTTRLVKSGGKYEMGNVNPIQFIQKQLGFADPNAQRLKEKREDDSINEMLKDAIKGGMLAYEKTQPMDALKKLLGAGSESHLEFWKRIFIAAWEGAKKAGMALLKLAKELGGAALNAILGGIPSPVRDAAGNLLGGITDFVGSFMPQSDKFGGVRGTSGSAAVGGQTGVALSASYSPFSASDIQSKGISIISGRGTRWGKLHAGYDLPAPQGTPTYAYLPGEITRNEFFPGQGNYGNAVEWKDSVYGQKHFFAHLSERTSLSVGDKFDQGAILGKSGDTGTPGSYHLHWEIGGLGSTVDPGAWVNSHPLPKKEDKPTPTTSGIFRVPVPGEDPSTDPKKVFVINTQNTTALTMPGITSSDNPYAAAVNNPLITLQSLSLVR